MRFSSSPSIKQCCPSYSIHEAIQSSFQFLSNTAQHQPLAALAASASLAHSYLNCDFSTSLHCLCSFDQISSWDFPHYPCLSLLCPLKAGKLFMSCPPSSPQSYYVQIHRNITHFFLLVVGPPTQLGLTILSGHGIRSKLSHEYIVLNI